MTKQKSTKRALLLSALSLLMCVSMLVGSTFAWFTDSVTSTGNKIQAGTLNIDLELLDKETGWASVKESRAPIFDYALWEPGYTDVKILKVENEGSLALKWMAKFVSENKPSILADVIDVYVRPSTTELAYPADRNLEGYTKVGTVADFVNTIEETTKGTLAADEVAYLGIALKMQESAGNDYKGKDLGAFDIQIIATQLNAEEDSFDKDYDIDAPLNFAPVSNANELKIALANKEENIVLTKDIVVDESFVVDYDANIDGAGYTICRTDGVALMTLDVDAPTVYTGVVFTVKSGTTLTLENIVVDGGAVWTGDIDEVLQRGTVNAGVTAVGALVATDPNAHIVLGEGAILQNNDGANAVNLNTRAGCTLTINGGEIINNHSAAGAIWGGGSITLNAGKVNGNHGSIGGAIRVVTNVGTVLTMNGGEMNHNLSDDVGGAIWAGSSRSNNEYVLNGGEMAYNYSKQAGGAIYAGYYETVKIGGTFKMHDNAAPAYGAIRFHDHASFVMTGGEIYNNGANSLFLYNNSASITGGKIVDSFGYSGGLGLTWGEAEVDGVITYNLSTNHNTAYLAKDFNAIKFAVNESDEHFANFNFKPASDYTYTEGDEAKLICMNDGYSTYWDAATGTFRLQAD